MNPLTEKARVEPRRVFRDLKPMSHLHLSDHYAPGRAEHWEHVEAVRAALGGKGFPFYPQLATGVK